MQTRTTSRILLAFCLAALLVFGTSTASADSIYGTIKYKDGSKAGREIGVSTSWNSKKAYPKRGQYELDFGGTVKKKISVYVKGTKVGTVYVSGRTRFDIIVP